MEMSSLLFLKLLQGPYDVVVLPGGNLGAQNLSEVNCPYNGSVRSIATSVDVLLSLLLLKCFGKETDTKIRTGDVKMVF